MDLVTSYPWEKSRNILLTTHAFPDADALGSMLALGRFLEKLGKETTFVISSDVPKSLLFLTRDKTVFTPQTLPLGTFDLAIVLDCADKELTRLPKSMWQNVRLVANIDHHPDNTRFGDYNLVDSNYSATAEIIYKIITNSGSSIDGFQATAMFAGLVGDTGSFRHSNAGSKVFNIAGELLSLGANFRLISKYLFTSKDSKQLKAWAYIIANAKYVETFRAFVSGITGEEINALDVNDDEFAGIVEILDTVPEANFSVFLRQRGDEVKVSLRSEHYKGVDVSALASRFGGGGHKLAAGFSIPGKLVKKDSDWYILSNPISSI